MLIMFNPHIKQSAYFKPPVPVTLNFDGIDRTASKDDQVTDLLWIPAFLVARFLYQFPALRPESDELFSEGVLAVVEVVNDESVSTEDIERKCAMFCSHRMQQYARALYLPVSVSGPTQYSKRRSGDKIPKGTSSPVEATIEDDHSELLIRDALESYGFDLDNLTTKQRRKLRRLFS